MKFSKKALGWGVFAAVACAAWAAPLAQAREGVGPAVGELTEKGQTWIKLKSDGEEKPREYLAEWSKKEGERDLNQFKDLVVGSRIEVSWRLSDAGGRIVTSVKVLKAAPPAEGNKSEGKSGGGEEKKEERK